MIFVDRYELRDTRMVELAVDVYLPLHHFLLACCLAHPFRDHLDRHHFPVLLRENGLVHLGVAALADQALQNDVIGDLLEFQTIPFEDNFDQRFLLLAL